MFRCFLISTVLLGLASDAWSDATRYWVFFADKAIAPGGEYRVLDEAREVLSPRALERRAKHGIFELSYGDVPLHQAYVRQVEATGATVRTASRWLNAVSVEATTEQLARITDLPCVNRVRGFTRAVSLEIPERVGQSALDSVAYGPSFAQNELSGVPELHARGLSGSGVLLCMLDTGFRTEHVSLTGLNYLAMRDFINGDSIVHNEEGQDTPDQQSHGTAVLSAAAGLDSGSIVGPAFGALWMLAKTEYVPTETEVEEDYYVAALEWADSAGADITSSSLGYIDWYDQSQMDGQTTVVTQAVNEAQRRGILVVTAQGNERGSEWGTVIAPADADSILAVGSTDSLGQLSGFSSPGPTADGRIKPDCSAQGSNTYCAMGFTTNQYWRLSGTSLATPIVAGIAALVMEANPDWTAQQVRQALMFTASQADFPDNDLGWGIVNGPVAADYVFSSVSPRVVLPNVVGLSVFPNPVNGIATLTLNLDRAQLGTVIVYNILGREVLHFGEQPYGSGVNLLTIPADQLASGKYLVKFAGDAGVAATSVVVLK